MKTRKNLPRNNRKLTRKIYRGGNDDIPCGVNEKGELTKCPPNHRCETIDDKKICKPSIEIKITDNKESISLFVPWKRHEKWLKYYDVLNKQISLIKSLRSDRKKNKKILIQENKELIDEIENKDLIKDIIGANNSDELIIQKIILMHLLKGNQDSDNTQIEEEETKESDEVEEETKESDEEEKETKEPVEEEKETEELNKVDLKESLKDIQEKVDLIPSDVDSKEYNEALKNKELLNREYLSKNNDYEFLYPELDDPNFNVKITKRKEFYDTQYDGTVYNVKEQAEKMCNAKFELMPHQLFVRNFMSIQTPYNSLLLYHGLGTGKTCSAIGISEEMRSYIKNIGSTQKIIVVASPNVQSNFIYQLFDERKLELQGGVWNLNTCVGNELLKELNPIQLQNLSKEKIISQIKSLIKQYYIFMGYGEFANFIKRKTMVDENAGLSASEKKIIESENIKKYFNNRLIIIDEVHNISAIQSNKQNKKTSAMLMHVCKHAENIRLLLLSATPMYNSYREIIWLTNLLNIVNKKSLIREEDVFDKEGNFIEEKITDDGRKIEGGKELLKRKLTGYVSYVRGENPYTFPYRIYPEIFDKTRVIQEGSYPKVQMNKKPIEKPMEHLPVYVNKIGDYQNKVYEFIMQQLRNKVFTTTFQGEEKNMPNFENMESFGYTLLTNPIQSLNIVYPNEEFDMLEKNIKERNEDEDEVQVTENEEFNMDKNEDIINNMVGSQGLNRIMTYKVTKSPYMLRNKFEYKPETVEKYGRIFAPDYLARYSYKISNICKIIKKSKGIIMIYSQYIDSGVVPVALALEEMGFTRYGTSSHTTSLFNNPPADPIDSISMLSKSQHNDSKEYTNTFNGAKYVMITGDKNFSPNNSADLKKIISPDNKYGEKIKVVLITKAAAEGLDFKNIRQLHILEPWYNASRLEQIIGRTVRNLSHCALPFEERNVEIYLHSSYKEEEETADLYVYRYAENKAIQIGKVSRILKENSVDCILNIGQNNLTLEKLTELSQGQEIELKTATMKDNETITYQIGDKPYTELCDYMDSCNFVCNPNAEINERDLYKNTYNEQFAKMNYSTIVKRIREAFREQFFYERKELIDNILLQHSYPIEHIDYALSQFVNNKSEHIVDRFGRYGYLINKENYYVFQPFEITDEYATLYEREIPIDLKYESLEMELPIEKEKQERKKPKEESEKVAEINFDLNVDNIISDLTKEIEQVHHERDIRVKLTEKYGNIDSINKRSLSQMRDKFKLNDNGSNWYKNAGKIYDILINTYKIPETLLEKIFVHHYLDMLPSDKHLLLVTRLYDFSLSSDKKYYALIKEYYDKKIMINGEKRSILLPSNNKNTLYIFSNTNTVLVEAKPTEVILFEKQVQDKFVINSTKVNDVFGFMSIFKNEITFKLKTLKDDKANRGVICEKLGKVDILHRIKPIINNNPYNTSDWPSYNSEDFDKLLKPGLCVLLECIMRYYNESNSGKLWFLDITESLASEIAQK